MKKIKFLLSVLLLLLFIGCSKKMYVPSSTIEQSTGHDLVSIDSVLKKMSPERAQLLKKLASKYRMTFSKLMPEDSNLVHLSDTIMKDFIEAKDRQNKMKR